MKLEESPLVSPLVLSLSPSCLCFYLCPFRVLDYRLFLVFGPAAVFGFVHFLFPQLLILSIPVPVKVCFACPRNCWCWCFLLVLFLFLRVLLLLAIFLESCLVLCRACSCDLIHIPTVGVVFVLFLFPVRVCLPLTRVMHRMSQIASGTSG